MARLLRGSTANPKPPAAAPGSPAASTTTHDITTPSKSSSAASSISQKRDAQSPSATPERTSIAASTTETRRPRTTSAGAADSSSSLRSHSSASRRVQLQVSECVETKTVTTTTRFTRQFPPVYVGDSQPLASLDVREYPLAMKEMPSEIANFAFTEETRREEFQHHVNAQNDEQATKHKGKARLQPAPSIKTGSQPHSQPLFSSFSSQQSSRDSSPSYSESGRPRSRSATRPAYAESSSAATRSTGQNKNSHSKSKSTRPLRSAVLQSMSERSRQKQPQDDDAATSREDIKKEAEEDEQAGEKYIFEDENGLCIIVGGAKGVPWSKNLVMEEPPPARPRLNHRNVQGPGGPVPVLIGLDPPAPLPPPMVNGVVGYAQSPTGSDSPTIFSSTVATPPITDAEAALSTDDELDDDSDTQIPVALPSPRLSPGLTPQQDTAANDSGDDDMEDASLGEAGTTSTSTMVDDSGTQGTLMGPTQSSTWADESQGNDSITGRELVPAGYYDDEPSDGLTRQRPISIDTNVLLEAFDSMKTEMKTYMMYQFLRRCPRPTLRVIFDTVTPTLKCDFLKRLPLELSYSVLSYLDVGDLCNAAQVSKQWRNIVDRNETGWKELFDHDGLILPPGELDKAIKQGWGWQDPVGPNSYELDLSLTSQIKAEDDLKESGAAPMSRLRSAKRKRGAYITSDRSKRRTLSHAGLTADEAEPDQLATARDYQQPLIDAKHKSEGPLSAASAAASAVPDPELGLPSLRQLHLFKSLYRRHHMIRQSWTNGKVRPSHIAFAAHPRHVITCLQFDDDKIITGSDDTLIHVYDTKTGELRKKLEGHEGGVWALQYEGNILVSGSTDRSVRVWDIEKGLCQQVFYGHTSTVRCLQILMPTDIGAAPDGSRIIRPEQPLIITGSRDSQLRVWRLPEAGSRRYIQTGPPAQETDCPYFVRVLTGHTHSVRAIAAYGDTLVSGSYDSTVRVWQISTGRCLHVLSGHAQKVYSVVLDTKRNRCISGSMDSLVKIWDLDTGACLFTLEGHTMLVGLLDLQDDRLVSAAADSTLRIWDPANGRCKHMLMAHTGAITCFEHDGRKVISGSEKTVKMWDVRTGDWVQDLLTELRGVWQVKFDQRRCVAAVQRGELTYVEILDFGAVRDGHRVEELGVRRVVGDLSLQQGVQRA